MADPIFIELKNGDDESQWNEIINTVEQLMKDAAVRYSTDLKKDDNVIGRLSMGIVAKNKKEVSGFLCAEVWYPSGGALWFETTDMYYRFDKPIGNDTMESWLMLILYKKLTGPNNPFGKVIEREFFPERVNKN